jgi:hypothetical protein
MQKQENVSVKKNLPAEERKKNEILRIFFLVQFNLHPYNDLCLISQAIIR